MCASINHERRRFIGAAGTAAAALGAARLGVVGCAIQQMACAALRNEGTLPPLTGATEWLNSPPLTPAGLRGKVVLVDFWTFTCINWLRTLPHVRAWSAKYKDQGLVVIGVHTPEFSIERDAGDVRRMAKQFGVEFPIALDPEYAVWRAFDNEYWPALYLIDAQGQVRHRQF